MKFNLEEYTDLDYAMHCPEEWMAEAFCNYLHDHGRAWCNGESYEQYTQYYTYEEETVYLFNKGMFGSSNVGYKILEFTDFTFSEEEETIVLDSSDSAPLNSFLDQFALS